MSKPDYTGLPPLPPVSQILPGLDMGMRPTTYIGYDLVVSCEEFLARKPTHGYTGVVIHLPMRDEDDFFCDEVAIAAAARTVAEYIAATRRVLVHCSGGLNRSGVVVVRALMQLGYTPRAALARAREQRDEFVLCNRVFERWTTGEVLPTAETSAFRYSEDAA